MQFKMKLPSEMTYWERVRFTILCLIALLSLLGFIHVTETRAHPDGATPYWYPSSFIYGYINGCAESVEQGQFPFTEEFWPDQNKIQLFYNHIFFLTLNFLQYGHDGDEYLI